MQENRVRSQSRVRSMFVTINSDVRVDCCPVLSVGTPVMIIRVDGLPVLSAGTPVIYENPVGRCITTACGASDINWERIGMPSRT